MKVPVRISQMKLTMPAVLCTSPLTCVLVTLLRSIDLMPELLKSRPSSTRSWSNFQPSAPPTR